MFRPSKVKYYYSVPSTRGIGTTVIGGITTTGNFHYSITHNTSTDTVEDWFKLLANKENLDGAVLVMDNHAAHHTKEVKTLCQENGCYILFMPSSR